MAFTQHVRATRPSYNNRLKRRDFRYLSLLYPYSVHRVCFWFSNQSIFAEIIISWTFEYDIFFFFFCTHPGLNSNIFRIHIENWRGGKSILVIREYGWTFGNSVKTIIIDDWQKKKRKRKKKLQFTPYRTLQLYTYTSVKSNCAYTRKTGFFVVPRVLPNCHVAFRYTQCVP